MFGETSYGMLWLWVIGAVVLGCILAYGILRAGVLAAVNASASTAIPRRHSEPRTRRNVRSEDRPSAVGTGVADPAHYFVKGS